MGILNYYAKFIPNLSGIARPIFDCVKLKDDNGKLKPFKWTREADEAFNLLKQKLTEAPILKIPDPKKEIHTVH